MKSVWTFVLDDDPTGTQGLSDVPIVVEARPDTLDWALSQGDLVYVLTNTRAMDEICATKVVREAIHQCNEAIARAGGRARFISRGDSTLRGHFPLEIRELVNESEVSINGCLLVPAFPEAGRLTLNGVHTVRSEGQQVPVAETEYARDATFGYTTSRLSEWALERCDPDWKVVELPSSVFDLGKDELIRFLESQAPFTVICPSIRHVADLEALAMAQRKAEALGVYYLVQSGPSYPRLLAERPAASATHLELSSTRGLVVVGSHTHTTTAQLEHLSANLPTVQIELDVRKLLSSQSGAEIDRAVRAACDALDGSLVVLSTSRDVVVGETPAASLHIAGVVAQALCQTAQQILSSGVGFVVAKGGITSRDIVADALDWPAARVLGPLLDETLPIWSSWQQSPQSPLAVIFPGNVGGPELLTRAVTKLRSAPVSSHERTDAS